MAAHGSPRSTGDIDVWVRATAENAERVFSALKAFRAPLSHLTAADLSAPDVIFQMGLPPCRIDIMTTVDGIELEAAWNNRLEVTVNGVAVPFLSVSDLISNKSATGRLKDRGDVDWLVNRRRV